MALTMKEDTDGDALREAVAAALHAMGVDRLRVEEARGSWPGHCAPWALRSPTCSVPWSAARRCYMATSDLKVYAYATNVSIIGPASTVHRARAALEREVPFHGAHLTWQEESQSLEDELLEAGRGGHGIAAVRRRLDRIQHRIDAAPLAVDEWNLLYRPAAAGGAAGGRGGAASQARASA